jgi:hypothetical protein
MNRLEKARSVSYTAPEWCFRRAQKKIAKGDYTFNVDATSIDAANMNAGGHGEHNPTSEAPQ